MVVSSTRESSDLGGRSLPATTGHGTRKNSLVVEKCVAKYLANDFIRDAACYSSLHRSSILPTDNYSCGRYLYPRDSLVHTGLVIRTGFYARYFASSTKFLTESDSTRIKSKDEKMILSIFIYVYFRNTILCNPQLAHNQHNLFLLL